MSRRPTRFSRRAAVAGAAVVATGLGAARLGAAAPAWQAGRPLPTAACPQLLVPAYFDPGPEWDRVIAAAPAVGFVILNPNSGVGERLDTGLQEVSRRAQAAGIGVLGYVFTDLAEADPEVVKDEIRLYQEWYAVDGIHLDGVQDDAYAIPYYADIAEVIRAGGQPSLPGGEALPGVVMLNPGYVPDEGFMAIADIVEVYEYYYDNYPSQEFPAWLQNYPADRFAHVVRDVPDQIAAVDQTLTLARERNAGYVYLTDRTDPTEYRELPTYWDTLVANACP